MKKLFKKTIMWVGSVAVVSSIIAFSVSTSKVVAEVPQVIDTTPEKIQALKNELVTRLAMECESKGTDSDRTPNIFDTNGQGSYGLWRWQIKSVIHYEKLLYGREVTPKEAILIALDDTKARQLTLDTIFKDSKGIENWYNCANKLELRPEIAVIKKLEH